MSTSIKRPAEEVDIVVRYAPEFRTDLAILNSIKIANLTQNLIPANRLIELRNGRGPASINHKNGRRLLTVSASIDERETSAAAIATAIHARDSQIRQDNLDYTIEAGGENEDTEESLTSLRSAFYVALLIIFMILASMFRSLSQPLLVLMTVPFSLIGVIIAFLLHGQPLSFLSILGIVGLSGVVVNDSIVLVDFANRLKEAHPELSNIEIALQAGSMRLRAVILTTITTVLGLLPTAYGIGGYDPFLVPMALSFAWGLAFSTLLTLGLIPILFVILENTRDRLRSWLNRHSKSPAV
ncbi:MAG: efflux RND transporter permease subunit [Leptospiraceae bacterium]|nr:efflux RND transporter permease subunit [Leptospiraceae bacterium]